MPITRRSQRAALEVEADSSLSDEHNGHHHQQQQQQAVEEMQQEEEEEEDEESDQQQPQQQTTSDVSDNSRPGLRLRSARREHASRASGRLSRVDAVLDKLKRQRERTQGRDWISDEEEEEGEEQQQDEQGREGAEVDDGQRVHHRRPQQRQLASAAARGAVGSVLAQYEEDDDDFDVGEPSPPPRKRARSQRSSGSSRRTSSHRFSAADEYDDGSGFVVYSDEDEEADYDDNQQAQQDGRQEAEEEWDNGQGQAEEEEEEEDDEGNETIGHMRLHNQLQAGSDDDSAGGDGAGSSSSRRRLSQVRHRGAAHTALSPLAALFAHSRSHFGPVLSLDVAFRYWMTYLASVLLDANASSQLLNASSTGYLLNKAVKVVEEQFESRLSNWVQSTTWAERPRERFHTAITQLPYITSRTLSAYDTMSDSARAAAAGPHSDETDEGEAAGASVWDSSSTLCDTCRGQHQATHYVEIFGVPYDHEELKHPFDAERIFPCQSHKHTLSLPHIATCQLTLPRALVPAQRITALDCVVCDARLACFVLVRWT